MYRLLRDNCSLQSAVIHTGIEESLKGGRSDLTSAAATAVTASVVSQRGIAIVIPAHQHSAIGRAAVQTGAGASAGAAA